MFSQNACQSFPSPIQCHPFQNLLPLSEYFQLLIIPLRKLVYKKEM